MALHQALATELSADETVLICSRRNDQFLHPNLELQLENRTDRRVHLAKLHIQRPAAGLDWLDQLNKGADGSRPTHPNADLKLYLRTSWIHAHEQSACSLKIWDGSVSIRRADLVESFDGVHRNSV